ncbi:hypothetical protein [Actinokineospora diospyrosa]|uniref:ANTAR domain-containing protein n=1 Tax=Actinokineospora diospyrosa TaxID=103728 RepID=A0ABT1IBK0_9PSEU|nr:hypothetical protein [Actinokineospora diospyrosa]MCP2270013.1 hypothetical protein [Actinokineospora diospyrosa]
MSIKKVDLSGLLDYWAEQKNLYKPGAYVVVLCGNATELDRDTAGFVMDNPAMLDDMSGPYTSISLVAWRSGEPASPGEGTYGGLSYLHTPHAERLGATSSYSLANSLQLPLDRFPLVLVSADPWESDRIAVFSLQDLPDDNDGLASFFAALLTACRAATSYQADKKLRLIRKHVESHLKGGKSALNTFSESGILAQVIEGIIKGLGGS